MRKLSAGLAILGAALLAWPIAIAPYSAFRDVPGGVVTGSLIAGFCLLLLAGLLYRRAGSHIQCLDGNVHPKLGSG